MNNEINYSYSFPNTICTISLIQKILIFFLPLLLIVATTTEGYYIEFIYLFVLSFFLVPFFKIASINRTIAICRKVIIENEKISVEEQVDNLIINDGSIFNNKRKILIVYILAVIFIIFSIFFNYYKAERLLRFVLYSINISFVLSILAVYDLRDISKYFKTVLNRNKQVFLERNNDVFQLQHILKWSSCEAVLNSVVFVFIVSALFLSVIVCYRNITSEILIAIPIINLSLLILLICKVTHQTGISLKALHQYDKKIKETLKFYYKPELRKVDTAFKTFIKTFQSEFKSRFNERQKKSKSSSKRKE